MKQEVAWRVNRAERLIKEARGYLNEAALLVDVVARGQLYHVTYELGEAITQVHTATADGRTVEE